MLKGGPPLAAMITNIRSTIISMTLMAAGLGRRELLGEGEHLVFLSVGCPLPSTMLASTQLLVKMGGMTHDT